MSARTIYRRRDASDQGWLDRERALTLALIAASVVVLYLCYRLLVPFLPALAWALALAVIAHPLHRWIHRWAPIPNLAAGLSVAIVVLAILAPATFVTQHLVREAGHYTKAVQDEFSSGRWRAAVEHRPNLKAGLNWVEARLGLAGNDQSSASHSNPPAASPSEGQADSSNPTPQPKGGVPFDSAIKFINQGLGSVVTGTVWLIMQLLITVLALFFFFRDRHKALAVLRSLMPLSEAETDEVFSRVDDTLHATIYGSLTVALVQGILGGLMFWWLGLPAPVLWGAIMALLAVVPGLGTFVVWAPTAIYLALRGDWTTALILAAWGGVAIALIDNLLYPFLVGKRLRFHTLLVFFAIMGGLTLFGASGIILGPLVLAIADALLHVWKSRTAFGGTVDGAEAA
jgi:predicted PurR-regulated permease PerM